MWNEDANMVIGMAYITPVRRAQIESLYSEALILVDEAQQVFADLRPFSKVDAPKVDVPRVGRSAAEQDPEFAVAVVSEVMLTTSRLTHILAWLLHHRAMISGDPTAREDDRAAVLDDVTPADWTICHHMPAAMRAIVAASERLVDRLTLLDHMWRETPMVPPAVVPVHDMMDMLRARL